MIVPMKHLTVLCVAAEQEATVEALRALGLVHLELTVGESEQFRSVQTNLAATERVNIILNAAKMGKAVTAVPGTSLTRTAEQRALLQRWLSEPLPAVDGHAQQQVETVQKLADMRQELMNEADRLTREIQRLRPFGEFDVTLPARLAAEGVPVTLFTAPVEQARTLPATTILQHDGAIAYCVQMGVCDLPEICTVIPIPDGALSVLEKRLHDVTHRARQIAQVFKHAAATRAVVARALSELRDAARFAVAVDTMQSEGAVAWIHGWLPEDETARLREAAARQSWGYVLRDPEADEIVPTLLRPPKLLKPMLTLFDGLGISPAYYESDVSVPFFAAFSIFFAMLVGDGGYGIILLCLALWAKRKHGSNAIVRDAMTLLTVFASATIVWGILSNTWLGSHPAVLSNPVSAWLNEPNGKGDGNMMLICFTLGVIHLSVARIWNAVVIFPDTKWLAQLGWLGVIWFMYFLSGSIVGVLALPGFMKIVLGVSILLIACFMLKKEELKTNGADLGMLPLNIIGSLGDIISYVRLFAVGLAGVKVAENFNEMATSLDLPLYIKIVPMILILLVGHALNFAMAGLSVLVHAVRLNTLEFSNHKGISWAGVRFQPFKRDASCSGGQQ